MWAQYKGLCPFEGDSTRKVRGKETLLWCFIYHRNDFPQIKTCSVLPVGLEQAACFLSWKLAACWNNAPGQNRGDVTSWRCGMVLLFDPRFRLNHMFTVFVTFEWTNTIVPFELFQILKQQTAAFELSSGTKGKDESISFGAVKCLHTHFAATNSSHPLNVTMGIKTTLLIHKWIFL